MACSICVHAAPVQEQNAADRDKEPRAYTEIDNSAGWFLVEIENVPSDWSAGGVEVAVWSSKNGQDDLTWYKASKRSDGSYVVNTNLVNHNFDTGLYYFDPYAVGTDGTKKYIDTCTAEFMASSEVSVKKTSSGYNVSVGNIVVPGGVQRVRYAVWSDVNGQDDLKWFNGSYSASSKSSSLSYSASEFSSYGKYYVDVYAVNAVGRSVYIGGTTYNIDEPKGGSAEVEIDNAAGWFLVTANDIPSGVKGVEAAVWSSVNGQDDLVWYPATKRSNGSYTVNTNLSRHNFDTGLYYFDTYLVDLNGNRKFVDSSSDKFEISTGGVSVERTSSVYKASVKNIVVPGGISKVRYAIWSDINGQDDLKWFNGSYNASSKSSSLSYKSSEFSSLGKYYIDVYGTNAVGKSVYLGGTTYTVDVLKAESVEIDIDNNAGWFLVTANGINSDSDIKEVKVAVWNEKNGQDDLAWYKASRQSDGRYTVNANLYNHDFLTGKYNFHVYATDSNGHNGCVGTATAEFKSECSGVEISYGGLYNKYNISISDTVIPGGVKGVRFAVWSENDWQDDIKWYDASGKDGIYSAAFNLGNHGDDGKYYIDAYAKTGTGVYIYINSTEYNFKNNEIADISCTITGGNTVQVVLSNVTTSGTYGLFALEAGKDYISPNDVPVAEASGSGSVTLNAPLNLDTADSLLTSKFVVGIKQNDGYWQASSGFYITNPEAVAENTFAFPTTENKKGLQINYNITEDAIELGANHTVVNVPLNTLFYNGSVPYKYNGETYYFSADYIRQLDTITANMASNGIITSFILLLQYDS